MTKNDHDNSRGIYMRRVPIVLQKDIMDCGVACLLSILKYHHGNIYYSKLKKIVKVTDKGTTAYSLAQAGEILGFKVEGKKGDIAQILQEDYPCIAHTQKDGYYHFVVLMGYDSKQEKVFLMDPSKGYDNVSLAYWKEICTEKYLFFKVKRSIINEKPKSIWTLLFPKEIFKKSLFFTLFFNLFFSLVEIFGLQETKIFFTYLLVKKDSLNIIYYFSFFLFFYFLVQGGIFLVRWFFLKYQNKIVLKEIRKWLTHLLNLPYYSFESSQKSEILLLTESLEDIYSYFFSFLECLFLEVPVFVFCLLFMKEQSSFFLLFLGFFFLSFFMILLFLYKHLSKQIENDLNKKNERNSFLLDSVGKLEVVKGLHQETFFGKKLRHYQFALQDANYRLAFSYEQKRLFTNIWLKGMRACFLYFFLDAFFRGKVNLYHYFLINLFFELLLTSYQKISELFILLPKVKIEIKKIEDIFCTKKELFPSRSILPFPHFTKLEIKSFSYPIEGKTNQALFSCKIMKQDKVVLHGSSGSGKSTLCKSILKLYEVQKQQIYLNDMDICYINLEDIRSRICYVSQEEGLFKGSLLENITLGKKVFSKTLNKVLDLTHVTDILKKKNISLDFPISSRMIPFSGGERKKILLARSLLLKRDIYLFDEVFESVDPKETFELIQNVLSYLNDKIVLVVSHHPEIDVLFHQVLTLKVSE